MKKIVIALLIMIIGSCAFYTSKPVTDAINEGKLKIDMTTREVREVIGNPDKTAVRRVAKDDIREIWTYNETSVDKTGAFLSCGLAPSPSYPAYYLVFRNDKLIGWNLPDLLAPDIIIEKRER